MSALELLSLAPLIVLAGGSVLLMLLISATRHHQATAQLTTLVLLVALAACWQAPGDDRITPLMAFDAYARTLQALVILAGLTVTLLLYGYLQELALPREEMYLLLLLAVLGASVLGGARHAATLLLGLEIMTIALFGMIAYPRESRASLEAVLKYLLLSAASSASLLLGLALIYAASGTLVLSEWAGRLAAASPADGQLARVGLALAIAGLGFKLSLVPFHLWTADVYAGAPAPVTGFLATVSKGAVAAVLLRLVMGAGLPSSLALLLGLIAITTIAAGNLLALQSRSVKRLLAYSSIAHVGYLLVPIILGGPLAAEAVLFYLAAYFATTLGAFGVVSRLSRPTGLADADDFETYRGLFWRRPVLTSVLTPMLLSLAGVPMTAGFLAKFYVLAVGVSLASWLLVAAIILGSAIGLYYYLRLTIVMFQRPAGGAPAREGELSESSLSSGVALAAMFVFVFWLGLWPQSLLGWLSQIGP